MKKLICILSLVIGMSAFSAENEIRLQAGISGGTTLLKHNNSTEMSDSNSGSRKGYLQGNVDISGHKVSYLRNTSTTEFNLGGGIELGGGRFFGSSDSNASQEYFFVNPYLKLEIGGEISSDFKLYGGLKGGIIDTIVTKSTVLKPGGLENRVGLSAKVYALGLYKERYVFELGTGVGNSLIYLSTGLNFGL